jgi:sulfoxide reductase heme-binding subunit YedZ
VHELRLQTGRWTLRILAASLAITPLRRITGQNWLIKYRRPIGLFAFFYAILHLITYMWLQQQFAWGDMLEDVTRRAYIIVGTLALLAMIPLALTSTKGWIRRMGKNWTKLHRLVYVSAILATVHYLWAVKKDTTAPLIYLAIFMSLLGFRVYLWLNDRRVKARKAVA